MHIKWKRRPIASAKREEVCSLDLLLLESSGEKGESEDLVVERLGSIEERFFLRGEAGLRMFHQGLFWQRLKQKLESLNLPPEAKRQVEEIAAKKIPLPAEGWALWPKRCSLSCPLDKPE